VEIEITEKNTPKGRVHVVKRIGEEIDLIKNNCAHVVDVDFSGDVFCTQCSWRSDPQKIIKHLIDGITGMNSARAQAKKALGWR